MITARPVMDVLRVYRTEQCSRTFEDDLRLHLLSGFVFNTPDYFIMGRPVSSKAGEAAIVDPHVDFMRSDLWTVDCWHVFAMAGNVGKVWDILPWELPLVSFERKNELRFYPAAAIRRLSALYQ